MIGWIRRCPMTDKQLSAFKDGVADGLLKGIRDRRRFSLEKDEAHYYNQGYDFGITLHCDLEENNA